METFPAACWAAWDTPGHEDIQSSGTSVALGAVGKARAAWPERQSLLHPGWSYGRHFWGHENEGNSYGEVCQESSRAGQGLILCIEKHAPQKHFFRKKKNSSYPNMSLEGVFKTFLVHRFTLIPFWNLTLDIWYYGPSIMSPMGSHRCQLSCLLYVPLVKVAAVSWVFVVEHNK